MDEITNNQEVEKQVAEVISAQENKKSVDRKKSNTKSSAPQAPSVKVSRPIAPVVVELQYRLNVFSHTGNVKPSISAPIYQDMCRRHGDIMRSISSTKWCTMDEILKSVWDLEKRMRHPSNRTRKAVETAVGELVNRHFVITR